MTTRLATNCFVYKFELTLLLLASNGLMKKTLMINGFNYPGHTEYLGKISNKRPLMIMLNKKLKVATLTTHIPISQVPKKITKSNRYMA